MERKELLKLLEEHALYRFVVAKERWGGEGWIGSLGLADANYYICG